MIPCPQPADTALVLGLDVAGYGLVRGLAREGVHVVGLWRRADEAARHSRYCSSVEVSPDTDEAWIGTILDQCSIHDRPILFPSNDRYADLLARYRGRLEPVSRFHWVTGRQMEAVIDKARMHDVCRAIDLPVPHTRRPHAWDIESQAATFHYPCLVKPRTSFRRALPTGAKVSIFSHPAELAAFYRSDAQLAEATLWQEIIPGGDDSIYQGTALAEEGSVRAIACVRKIRQFAPGFGITSFGVTEREPVVIEQTARLLGALRWSGLASVEFKRSQADGRFYFIEMNPRLPWYNALFAQSGINLAYMTWRIFAGVPVEPATQKDGVHWMSLPSDLASFWNRRGHGTMSLSDWLPDVGNADSFAWFDRADPAPAVANAARLSGMGLLHLAHELLGTG